jgi:non-specific serine/threonine protein kinase
VAAWALGDWTVADRYYAEALPLARRLGDPWVLYVALTDQGAALEVRGDYESARRRWQEALIVVRASRDQASEAVLLNMCGQLDIFEGNFAAGCALCQESLDLARQMGDEWVIWGALHALAQAALAQGDLVTARALSYEALDLNLTRRPAVLLVLGQVAIADADYSAARQHLTDALSCLENIQDPVATAQILEAFAHLTSGMGKSDVALRLAAAAAQEMVDALGSQSVELLPHHPLSRERRERWLVPLRKTLRAEDAQRWWAEGSALTLVEAVALAESSMRVVASARVPQTDPAGSSPLTPRQQEVAVLVADGLTNRQIAARLVITERAAGAHIEHILDRLGFDSRAQIAVWASGRGLLAPRSD